MHMPKYSIVLPTLNGEETLRVTLPEMLKTDRDDVEWVISDNHSQDNTSNLIRSLDDPRVRLVQPPRRLPAGEHLEFAYRQARGEWQGHLGDDDFLFPSRFKVLDRVLADSTALVVRGEQVRYYWPDYPDAALANTIDPASYERTVRLMPGKDLAAISLNELGVHGGGSWIVHRSIVESIRSRCGYFCSPQHLEFFAMRSACAAAPQAAIVGLPIWVGGRHTKSSGTQALAPKQVTERDAWDWSFEDPKPWNHCPFQFKSYSTISLDAAMTVRERFQDVLAETKIDWPAWLPRVQREMERLIGYQQLDEAAREDFAQGLTKLAPRIRLRYWLKRQHPQLAKALRPLFGAVQSGGRATDGNSLAAGHSHAERFGWPDTLAAEKCGIKDIVGVPRWIESSFPGFFSGN